MTGRLVVGIFVGGKASRMGGVAKGLLPAPDTGEPLAARLARLSREAVPDAEVVLVGAADRYGALGLPSIPDEPTGSGPLAGMVALLRHAHTVGGDALAIAGDLPHMTTGLVIRLAVEWPGARALAPRPGGIWQPLFARYAPPVCLAVAEGLVARGRLAARGILEELGERASVLPCSDAEARLLADWDTPEAVRASRH